MLTDEKAKRIKPLRNRILVKLCSIPREAKVNGIVQPNRFAHKKKLRFARVISVHKDVALIESGMLVVINRMYGGKITKGFPGEGDFRIVSPDQIEGIIEDKDFDPVKYWFVI